MLLFQPSEGGFNPDETDDPPNTIDGQEGFIGHSRVNVSLCGSEDNLEVLASPYDLPAMADNLTLTHKAGKGIGRNRFYISGFSQQ